MELRDLNQFIELLPDEMKKWDFFERKYLCRGGDPTRVEPDTTNLPKEFLPENASVFLIEAYWIDLEHVVLFGKDNLAPELINIFFRSFNGKDQVLFFVHPFGHSFFANFLSVSSARAVTSVSFFCLPTSSTRTVLVWTEDLSGFKPIFIKLSLPASLGSNFRVLSNVTIARSTGVSLLLSEATESLPHSFKFLSEPFGVCPKSLPNAGYLIRPIPDEIYTDDKMYVPTFALYASPPGNEVPLLVNLIKNSGKTALEYLEENLLVPFARHWLELVIDQGIIPEPHAQNLLIEFNSEYNFTGCFVHRDFEGFYFDLLFREKSKLPVPSQLPFINSIQADYKQDNYSVRMLRSIYNYFQGNVLYSIQKALTTWQQSGLIVTEIAPGIVERSFREALESEFFFRTGKVICLNSYDDYVAFSKAIQTEKSYALVD